MEKFSEREAARQLRRLDEAGITYNLNIIIGAAGPARLREHARANAALVSAAHPTLVFVSPLHVDPATPLERMVADGAFRECTVGQYIEEERAFLSDLRVEGCAFANGDFSSADGWSVPPPRKDQGTYEREPFDDAATFCDAAEPYGVVDGCGVANQFRRLVQTIHVRKGVRVSVTFRARGFDNPEEDY